MKKPDTDSPMVNLHDDKQAPRETYHLDDSEKEQYNVILERIINARNDREQARDKFDGMTYEDAYLSNRRAAISYLAPKKNDEEVRVNTGVTEKRIEFVLNELLAQNLTAEIRAFDSDDNVLDEAGNTFSDLVERTEQMENAKEKDIFILYEFLTQPSVFVEELWIDETKDTGRRSLMKRKRCDRRLVQGVQMYLGDINLPDTRFNEQPYLVKYARMPYARAKMTFGHLDNWQYVPCGPYNSIVPISRDLYRNNTLTKDEVEVYYYWSYPDNEFQLLINGIPMYPPGEKYSKHYPDLGRYHIDMVTLKPLGSDFAYGKPLTASAKTLQALDNETVRNMIRKFRQAIEPPTATTSGKIFTKDIWNAGAMTFGLDADDIKPLIQHQGLTPAEFSFHDLVEKKINEFVGTSQIEPLQNKSATTATELVLAQKHAMKMLGLAVLGAMRLKSHLAIMRVKNILANYTKGSGKSVDPITKKLRTMYASFALEDTDLGNGAVGTKRIMFGDQPISREQKLSEFAQEERSKDEGKPVRFKHVNIPALKNIKAHFYANVVPKENESSQLDKIRFMDKLKQMGMVTQITGLPVNPGKVVEGFEKVHKDRGLFQKEAPQPMMGQPQQQQGNQQVPRDNPATMADQIPEAGEGMPSL